MFKNKSSLILCFLIKSTSYATPWNEKEPPKKPGTSLNSTLDNSIDEEKADSKNSIEEEKITEEACDNYPDLLYKRSSSPMTENMGQEPKKKVHISEEDSEVDLLIQEMQNFNFSNQFTITETSTQLTLSDEKNSCSFPFWVEPKNLLEKIDLSIKHLKLNSEIKKDAPNPEKENGKKNFPLIKSVLPTIKKLKKLDIMGLHSVDSSEFLAFIDLSQLEELFISGVKILKLPVHKINVPNLKKIRLSFLENFHIDNFCKLNKEGVDKNLFLKGYSEKNFNLAENGTFSPKAPKNILYHSEAFDHFWVKSPTKPQESRPSTLNGMVPFYQLTFENSQHSYRRMLAQKVQRSLQE
ncbi:MAG: hypothetical protein BGO07_02605 [Alphaproteobacteria bacterium 40-19]|nr:MAG: hypothetical protein BGO07_02605 [Alphaproteobacteria bacterium 40-19]